MPLAGRRAAIGQAGAPRTLNPESSTSHAERARRKPENGALAPPLPRSPGMDRGGSRGRDLLRAAQGQGVSLAGQVPERLAAPSRRLDQRGHALVPGAARGAASLPGNQRAAELSDGLDPGPAPVAALAGDDRGHRGPGLRRPRRASRRLHADRPALHGDHRLLVGEHEHPGAGVHVHSHRGVGGPRGRHRGLQVRAGEHGGAAHPGPDADGAHLRLPHPHPSCSSASARWWASSRARSTPAPRWCATWCWDCRGCRGTWWNRG